ncbi:MAG: hypothetical protein KTR19_02140 [Hyphomicrobiales bacterium]|nr:hypothetical protein [Hyphomicrobiales bacterium]
MFRGNLYGLIIVILSFAIAVIATVKQVQQSGVRVELIIQPILPPTQLADPGRDPRQEVTFNTH